MYMYEYFFKFNLLDIYLFDNIMMYKTLPYTIVIEPLLRMIHVRNCATCRRHVANHNIIV